MKRVVVGRLTGIFGIHGELKCKATALGDGAFAVGAAFATGIEPDARTLRCSGVRRHHERLLVKFEGIATPEAARELVRLELFAERDALVLGPDEYMDADLIGMRLIDEADRELGRVSAVQHFPAQDCLIVEPGGGMVPLVKAFVREVDLEARTIRTSLPEGLL